MWGHLLILVWRRIATAIVPRLSILTSTLILILIRFASLIVTCTLIATCWATRRLLTRLATVSCLLRLSRWNACLESTAYQLGERLWCTVPNRQNLAIFQALLRKLRIYCPISQCTLLSSGCWRAGRLIIASCRRTSASPLVVRRTICMAVLVLVLVLISRGWVDLDGHLLGDFQKFESLGEIKGGHAILFQTQMDHAKVVEEVLWVQLATF